MDGKLASREWCRTVVLIQADVTEYQAWQKLQQLHSSKASQLVLKDLFAQDSSRFSKHSISFESSSPDTTILLDYSKNLIDDEVLSSLFDLAREAQVEKFRDAMFAGEHINTSEGRAVLHIALRNPPASAGGWKINEEGAGDEVHAVLAHIKEFSEQVRSGAWKGYTGKSIDTVVNIGIGGSDLGPVMVCEALKNYSKRDLKTHFVSNIDGTDLAEVLKLCNPETTIFIIASKTFTTQETITNAESAKDWFLQSAKEVSHVSPYQTTS
jgi:glucose-6-phosphate isomerase